MARINNRYAALVSEIDEISEICEREGHVEVCALLDEVGAELAEAPAQAPKAAKAKTAGSRELRTIAAQLKQSGNVREARNVLKVADEMDLGLENEETMPPVDEEPGAEVPEAGGCTPCPTCGANPPQPEEAPEGMGEEPALGEEPGLEPSDTEVAAAMRILDRKLAGFPKVAEDTNELAEEALDKAESDAKKNLRSDPEAKSAAKRLLAEITALEASLTPRAKRTPARPAPASQKAAATVRQIARKLEADGKPGLARKVRGLLG